MRLWNNDFRFSLSEIIYQNREVKDLHHPTMEMSSSPEGGQDTINMHADMLVNCKEKTTNMIAVQKFFKN